jgi:hypothetical protein
VPVASKCPSAYLGPFLFSTGIGPENAIRNGVVGWALRAETPSSSLRSMASASAPGSETVMDRILTKRLCDTAVCAGLVVLALWPALQPVQE